tara:strand:+ start:37 stop:408 length:372 start_codon:yes stop_codon:yes gene_type:complete
MKNLLIKPTLNVKDALKQLNKVGGKCLVVVNKENKLLGTLSDGDVRRAIHKGKYPKNKINLQVHYIPIHLQPFYRKNYGFKIGDFPKAEKFYAKEVSLPIYFSLKDNQIYNIINLIRKFINKK